MSSDPQAMMDEIAFEAQRVGLIDSNHMPRRSDPLMFVSDLWRENPAALDRLNLSRESLPKPSALTTLSDVLDILR